jgi:hypothetical protein
MHLQKQDATHIYKRPLTSVPLGGVRCLWLLLPHDLLCRFQLMITFTSCFVMGKAHEDIPKIRGLGFSDA